MALSLGIKTGSKIAVGDHCIEVKAIVPPNLIVVSVNGGVDIVVSDQARTNISPDVYVFSGTRGGKGNRLAFEAHRSIVIRRLG